MNKKAMILLGVALMLPLTAEAKSKFWRNVLIGGAVGTGAYLLMHKSSNNTQPQQASQPVTVANDNSDVITCEKYSNAQLCKTSRSATGAIECASDDWGAWCLTPQQYAINAGYKTINRIGTQFNGDKIYLLMDVSK